MKKLTFAFFFVFVFAAIFSFQGCDSTSSDGGDDPNTPGTTNAGVLLGEVRGVSTYGSPSDLDGVTITIGSSSALSNSQGWFSVPSVPAGTRVQVKFEKDGYVTTYKLVDVVVGQTTFVEATLSVIGTTTTVGTSGGTVNVNGGATVTFGSNAFSNGGAVDVEATYFSPTSSHFADAFPGDFTGRSTGGTEGTLESFGFMEINLTSGGNTVNLASGQTATLSIPVPSGMSNPPSTIPLWYYDEAAKIWKEQGSATLVGNQYVGTVTHFTSWNYDRFYDVSFITGRVVDIDGNPVNHAYVKMDGVDYSGRSYRYTNSDGTFRIGVRPNSTVIITASKGGVDSTPLTRTTPANGQESNIGDIVLSAPWTTITLTWGENPRDLDSHFLIPASTGGGNGSHVSYQNYGSLTSYPHTTLDTDDRYSYGPENVTSVRKYDGTYQYYVHWYTGSGNLQTSGAKVTVLLNGNLYTFNVPSTGDVAHTYWHVFDMTASGGNVTLSSVNVIQETAPGSTGQLMKAYPPKD